MISVCVQHHPERAELLGPIGERLGEHEVVADPEPAGVRSPLRCYLECLRRTPAEATHRVVVQDDAWPCTDFRARCDAAVAERPDSLIAFFVPGTPGGGANRVRSASALGQRWTEIGGSMWIPAIALAWPAALAHEFVAFCLHPRYAKRKGDDAIIHRFVRSKRLEVWATVPSLVEHPDVVDSLIGRRARAGRDKARVAALFAES